MALQLFMQVWCERHVAAGVGWLVGLLPGVSSVVPVAGEEGDCGVALYPCGMRCMTVVKGGRQG